ncbi:hypothetical protein [Arcobacter sp. CECT 9188]|uniref:hypothetical protein n=1 Tax=Arcobacter sp. CECT 9188 TaxID=2044505 RepID=UPI000DE85B23|nr:hypothetical protein [Arcobacter sp. CECT 9188]RBQ27639.1 hypothetical protein CRU88_02935 [Arcobacter sp. CECT 9188]
MSDLEIFQLAGAIALALKGEKEAIADVELLLKRHPEMFKNVKDVVNTINEVVKEPEIIMDNPRKEIGGILTAKKLNNKRIGDVIIKNEKGTNRILHANKSRFSKFKTLEKIKKQQLVETPTPSTHRDLPTKGLTANDLLSSSKEHSTVTNETIIPQNSEKKPFKPTGKYKNFQDKDIEK